LVSVKEETEPKRNGKQVNKTKPWRFDQFWR